MIVLVHFIRFQMPEALFWEEGCSFFVKSLVPFTGTTNMYGMFTHRMKPADI